MFVPIVKEKERFEIPVDDLLVYVENVMDMVAYAKINLMEQKSEGWF